MGIAISAGGDQTYSELGLQFTYADLPIKEGIKDNSKIFFPILTENMLCPLIRTVSARGVTTGFD